MPGGTRISCILAELFPLLHIVLFLFFVHSLVLLALAVLALFRAAGRLRLLLCPPDALPDGVKQLQIDLHDMQQILLDCHIVKSKL